MRAPTGNIGTTGGFDVLFLSGRGPERSAEANPRAAVPHGGSAKPPPARLLDHDAAGVPAAAVRARRARRLDLSPWHRPAVVQPVVVGSAVLLLRSREGLEVRHAVP